MRLALEWLWSSGWLCIGFVIFAASTYLNNMSRKLKAVTREEKYRADLLYACANCGHERDSHDKKLRCLFNPGTTYTRGTLR